MPTSSFPPPPPHPPIKMVNSCNNMYQDTRDVEHLTLRCAWACISICDQTCCLHLCMYIFFIITLNTIILALLILPITHTVINLNSFLSETGQLKSVKAHTELTKDKHNKRHTIAGVRMHGVTIYSPCFLPCGRTRLAFGNPA